MISSIAAFLGTCIVALFVIAAIFQESIITNLAVLSMWIIIPAGIVLLLFG